MKTAWSKHPGGSSFEGAVGGGNAADPSHPQPVRQQGEGMDRKEALALLKLPETADREAISQRYNVLFKKYADARQDENGVPLSAYEEAYNLLSGIEYRDLRAEAERKRRQEHPNPVLKALRIDPERASHLVYYYKWHAIGVVAALAIIVSIIWSMVTHVDPDFKVLLVGTVGTTDVEKLTAEVQNAMPGTKAVQIQQIMLGEGTDGQTEIAMQQKLMVELAAGQNDVVLVDAERFEIYARQGMFKSLDDRLSEYGTTAEAQQAQRIALEDEEGTGGTEAHVYGIDVTGSEWLKAHDVYGTKIIAAELVNGEFADKADAFLELIDSD